MAGQSLTPNSTLPDLRQSTEEMDDTDSLTCCGICLCESGKAVRGEIDSCSHYFCFVCIMEWAKVESRCPMCKRRFTSICRPAKQGVFSSQRIVNVPQRDQVYHISGNATVGPFDPYGQVSCSVCNTDVDESLLLLCDLCDCASHTYCVGLGATVPEGDWFCNDCAVSRNEHESINLDSNDRGENVLAKLKDESKDCVGTAVDQNFVQTSDIMGEAELDVSISEIVGEVDDCRRSKRVSASGGRQPVVVEELRDVPDGRTSQTECGERRSRSLSDAMAQTNARTLGRCRNVHGHIRVLRENWNSLQRGSLSFSSVSVESGARSGGNRNASGVSPDCAGQDGSCCRTRPDGCSDDIDKAWKMMDKAKSIQKDATNTQKVSPASKCTPVKGNAFKSSTATLCLPETHQVGTSYFGSTTNVKQPKRVSSEKEDEKLVTSKFEVNKRTRVASNNVVGSTQSLPKVCAPGASTSLCTLQQHTSSQTGVFHHKCSTFVLRNQSNSLPNIDSENHRFSKSEMTTSFVEGKVKNGATCVVSHEARRDDDAKREIQSLVKLNLKLLSKDKGLEVEAFKRIARLSTHKILAAYGFEHSRHVTRAISTPNCSHSETNHLLGKSSVTINSCRQCFFSFVKNVVHSTLSDVKPR